MDTKYKMVLIGGIVAAVALAFFLSPYASESPDGLEKVGEDQGFMKSAEKSESAPMPDYSIPSLGEEHPMSTRLAGLAGTLAVLIAGLGIGYAVRRRNKPAAKE